MKRAVLIILAVLLIAGLAACAGRQNGTSPSDTNALHTPQPNTPASTKRPQNESDGYAAKDPSIVAHGRLQRLNPSDSFVINALRLDGDRSAEDNGREKAADGIREHFEPGETITAYFDGSISEAAEGRVKAVLVAHRSAAEYYDWKPADFEREALFVADIAAPGEDGLLFSAAVPEDAEMGDYDLIFFANGLHVCRVSVKIAPRA